MFVHLKAVLETLLFMVDFTIKCWLLLTLRWLFNQVYFIPCKEIKLLIRAYCGVIYYTMSDPEYFFLLEKTCTIFIH